MLNFLSGLKTFSLSSICSSSIEPAGVLVSSRTEPSWAPQNAAAPIKLAVQPLPKLRKSVIIKKEENRTPYH